ncbi:unnamed protein product [Pedinophyceae sp. YPF-701]|nr:unnamed protein product [Pedinophyceae sp. YPF-701]
MSVINLTAVDVLNNPAPFSEPLQFQISYECLSSLPDDVEWKVTYVGSAEDERHDQELESILVGPMQQGAFRFVLETRAPEPAKIPEDDLVGTTAVILTCHYRNQEFVRVGYVVVIDYEDEELRTNNPKPHDPSRLVRHVIADKPRVTKHNIAWGDDPEGLAMPTPTMEQEGCEMVEEDAGDAMDDAAAPSAAVGGMDME